MPCLIDLYEAYKKDRDKFEILAFHDGTVKDFAELDKKSERPRERFWKGRDLPFPILLDATGQTIKAWGVNAFPTMLLIAPDGKLVGEVQERELEDKLPPLPMSVRAARALDGNMPTFRLEKSTLERAIQLMARLSNIPIRFDHASLKSAGVELDAPLPLEMTANISLRSALNLILEAYNLSYMQDDQGLLIKVRETGATSERLSPRQRAAVKRLEKALDQKMNFDFENTPLEDVARFFDEGIPGEAVILSPRDCKTRLLDPKVHVTGSAKNVPLREALAKLLGPLGVGYTIRDEVMVLTAKSKTTAK